MAEDQNTQAPVVPSLPTGAKPETAGFLPDLETDPVSDAYFDFITERFGALPKPLRDYLNSHKTAERFRLAAEAAHLTKDERDLAYSLLLRVFFGLLKPADFPDELWNLLEWSDADEGRCTDLAIQLLGNILLPAEKYLGDVSTLILQYGGRLDSFSVEPVEHRAVTYEDGAKEVADALDLALAAEDRARLQHILASRLRDVRDNLETKEMLMRSRKVGGLEMDEATIERILGVLGEKAKITKYVERLEAPTPVQLSVPAASAGDASVHVEPNEPPPAAAPAPAAPASPAPSGPKQFTSSDIKAIYNGSDEERADLTRRLSKFKEVTGEDPAREKDAFNEILYPPDLGPVEPRFVVVALLAMADDSSLVSLLTEDLRIREIINKYLVERQMQGAAFRFAEKPGDPEFMNILLQLALRAFAAMPDAESARFGLRVCRALSRSGYDEYDGLVAFDADLGAFRWLKPIDL